MTTAAQTPRSGPRPGAAGPVVRGALVTTLAVGALAAILGAVLGGTPALLGALVGTAMVCLFFGLGVVVLDAVASVAPGLSMLVALLTYGLKVVLIGLVFLGLRRSGVLDHTIDPRWLGGTVIAATMVWLAAHVRASLRVRIPVYELGLSNRSDEAPSASARGQEAGER